MLVNTGPSRAPNEEVGQPSTRIFKKLIADRDDCRQRALPVPLEEDDDFVATLKQLLAAEMSN